MKMNQRIFVCFLALIVGFNGCANREKLGLGKGSMLGSLADSVLSTTGASQYTGNVSLSEVGSEIEEGTKELSASEQYFLGRSVSATILGRYALRENQVLTGYITKIGKTLAGYSDMPDTFKGYKFAVLNTDEVNAMAAPGGFIFVTMGLLKILPNEDALAAVLAHEIAHIVNEDGVNAISSSHLTKALVLVGRGAASEATSGSFVGQELTNIFSESVGDVVHTMLDKGYSRRQEYSADAYAAELLARAGYNPQSLETVFLALQKLEGSSEGGWFSTHPDPEDRIDEVKDVVAALPAANPQAEQVRAARFSAAMKGIS